MEKKENDVENNIVNLEALDENNLNNESKSRNKKSI